MSFPLANWPHQLALAKKHLNVTFNDDDVLICEMIAAAQDHLERLLGYKFDDRFPSTDENEFPALPASLRRALLLLVAHFYENREAVLVGVNAQDLPLGVWDVVAEFRDYWSEADVG